VGITMFKFIDNIISDNVSDSKQHGYYQKQGIIIPLKDLELNISFPTDDESVIQTS